MSACARLNRYTFKIMSSVYYLPVAYDAVEHRFIEKRSNLIPFAIGLLLSIGFIYHDFFIVLPNFNTDQSAFTLAVFIVELTVFATVPICVVCNSFVHRKEIVQLLNMLFADQNVLDLGGTYGNKSVQPFSIANRYVKVLYAIVALICFYNYINMIHTMHTFLELTLISRFLLTTQYIYLYYLCVSMVRLRMQQLRVLFLDHQHEHDFEQLLCLFLERFRQYIAQIERINQCLSAPLLGMLLQALIELAYFMYEWFRVISTGQVVNGNYVSVQQWITSQFWQLMYGNVLLLLVPSCEQASNEVEETALCTRHFDDYRLQNTRAAKQIQNFLLKNLHQKKKFSACGFFDIDNTVIYMVFSSIVTYLVILIQFKQLETDLTQAGDGYNVTSNVSTVQP
ncbi:AGAP009805-PK [Anopheles gambiae str. PEST]|uniref:Gustatory receptor n=1 Tax=Anopheles gambiae TaxID=7165 RepID=Q7PK29_ANOGA|nr:AGAP009805-PK [Anopheles gambiae str. PEST]